MAAAEFDEATLRERLRSAPRVPSPTPRLLRIDRAAYLESEEDTERQPELEEATRELVERLGGRLGKAVQRGAQARRAGHTITPPPTIVWFYELPSGALDR
jgi:hypothetical protein